jgi:ribosome maturation factor RimP
VNQELEAVVRKGLDSVGFDLVELRNGGTKTRLVVEVRIDRRDGLEVTVADCATASRAVEGLLEASGLVPENYELQVSSPGERSLRLPGDWRRFTGRWVNVLSPDFGGRFEAKIVSVEGEEGDLTVVLREERGREKRIPLAAVKEARLAFHL